MAESAVKGQNASPTDVAKTVRADRLKVGDVIRMRDPDRRFEGFHRIESIKRRSYPTGPDELTFVHSDGLRICVCHTAPTLVEVR